MSDSMRPHRRQPIRLHRAWDSPGKNTGGLPFPSPMHESEVESEKVGLKLNIQKMKIMASGPITTWEIDGETVETVSDFIFWAPKSL